MKKPGYCTLCEAPVFEFSGDRPTIPTENAWRVNFLLTDDTSADITFCDDCLADINGNLERIWEICLERFDFEERDRPPSPEKDAIISHLKDQSLVREQARTRWDALV